MSTENDLQWMADAKADAKAAREAPYAREEAEQHAAAPTLAFAPAGPAAANHVSREKLTTKQWQMVKALSAVYVANGGEVDEYGDITMLRFLLDKDWNLAAAERKAKSTAAWRAKVDYTILYYTFIVD